MKKKIIIKMHGFIFIQLDFGKWEKLDPITYNTFGAITHHRDIYETLAQAIASAIVRKAV